MYTNIPQCVEFNCDNIAYYGLLPGVLTHCDSHKHLINGNIVKNNTKCFKNQYVFLLSSNICQFKPDIKNPNLTNLSSEIKKPAKVKKLIHPILIKNKNNPSLIRIISAPIFNYRRPHQNLKPKNMFEIKKKYTFNIELENKIKNKSENVKDIEIDDVMLDEELLDLV